MSTGDPMLAESCPFVSVIIPARNEEDFIAHAVRAVVEQDYPHDRMEIIVVDGSSDDGTVAEIGEAAGQRVEPGKWVAVNESTPLLLLENPLRVTPTSLNLGLKHARGDVIIRVDGHCVIEPGYVSRCVEVLRDTGYEMVGGVCITEGETQTARAIAAAQSSPFGVGNVAFRVQQEQPGFVDTVPFGAWPRRVFDEVGIFDEELVRNQDDEFAFRITQAGGRVFYDPSIRSRYFSRSTLPRLWRQYFEYGAYKVRVAQKRGGFASVRHVVPAAFVAGTVGTVGLAAVKRKPWLALSVIAPYAAFNVAASWRLATRKELPWTVISRAFAILHVGYGAGFLTGLWRYRRGFRTLMPTARTRRT